MLFTGLGLFCTYFIHRLQVFRHGGHRCAGTQRPLYLQQKYIVNKVESMKKLDFCHSWSKQSVKLIRSVIFQLTHFVGTKNNILNLGVCKQYINEQGEHAGYPISSTCLVLCSTRRGVGRRRGGQDCGGQGGTRLLKRRGKSWLQRYTKQWYLKVQERQNKGMKRRRMSYLRCSFSQLGEIARCGPVVLEMAPDQVASSQGWHEGQLSCQHWATHYPC